MLELFVVCRYNVQIVSHQLVELTHKRKLITSVIIIASSLFFGQCERNSLYINSSDALSFFGMDYLFAFSQVNVRVGGIDYPNGSAYNFGTLHEFN